MEERKYTTLEFILHFIEAYDELHQRGLISAEQLERVRSLLESIETLPPELFCERLGRIFPEGISE